MSRECGDTLMAIRSVARQEEYHRRKTFKEELIELLRRHDMTFDEQYLFEAE